MAGDARRGGIFPRARYLASYARYEEMPASSRPEYAVVGRSNVGKSAFINHVFADRRLARVSSTPGKTRLANVFECSNGVLWVDLPGYGYARAGGAQKRRWAQLIGDYCERRPNLAGIIWLIDARHPGLEQDLEAHAWLQGLAHPVLMVMTKCDKLSRAEAAAHAQAHAKVFGCVEPPVRYSIHDAGARARFWATFERWRLCCGD